MPVRAGSTMSFWPSLIFSGMKNGEATWKTTRQPAIASSKEPSSRRSASNSVSLPGNSASICRSGRTFAAFARLRTVACTS